MKWNFLKRSKPASTGRVIRSARVMPEHARVLREVNMRTLRMLRSYEAAVTSNLTADLPVSITSANAEILVSISAARSRARKAERDDPYAWQIINLYQDNVGGDEPFRLEMHVGKRDSTGKFIEETETNQEIEDAWNEAGLPENCTVRRDMSRSEVYWQAISAIVRDGGILARHYAGFPNNEFGYAIDPIEMDRLDHYFNRPRTGNQSEIQFSIEMDEYHGASFYHILTRHPGDVFAWSNQPRYRERVPANDVIATWDIRTRAGQYVAVPRFSSIITRLHQNRQFDTAHVTAAIWSACKPVFILQKLPNDFNGPMPEWVRTQLEGLDDGGAEGGDSTAEGQKVGGVSPGETETLPPYHEPFLVDPKFPIEAATGFKKDNLRAASAGSGVPYHMLANDLEGVNFSSGRLGENQFHDTCKKLQNHFITNYVRRHFNRWLVYAIASGKVKQPMTRLRELQVAAKFYGRRWPYINPLQDAQADILRIEAGLTSRSRVIAESDRGGDVETVDAEIASDKEIDEAHDLDFSASDPTTPSLKKGEVGQELPTPENDTELPPRKGGKQTIKSNNGNGHHRLNLA